MEVVQDPVLIALQPIQEEWARIKYQVVDEDRQITALENLTKKAENLEARYPNRAEPKIWEGIIISTEAGIDGGLGALGKVKKAKALFESALQQDEKALAGSAHTSLGSLYYKVPGWPVAFGDDEEAEKHLKMALLINPDGIDPNFFYADFLIEDGRETEAKQYLVKALNAPDRPDRPMADAGRRQEIKAALAKLEK
ncbi:MAG: hypothetical protein JKY71_10475 [Alphaproteobacteria bacterium]|nr:hypothetical protein [Alphaproteobacteria bacterium]